MAVFYCDSCHQMLPMLMFSHMDYQSWCVDCALDQNIALVTDGTASDEERDEDGFA